MEHAFDISVVIPAYNVEAVVGRAIKSALNQTLPPQEIIAVADGSTDRTVEVIKKFPQVKYVYDEKRGPASARNKGIEAASSEWIAFLDGDDIWKPCHLEGISSIIKRNDVVWACGGKKIIKADKTEVKVDTSQWEHLLVDGEVFENFFEAYAKGVPIETPGMVIKRKVLEDLGAFDVTFPVGEDLDLWLRIAHKFPRIGFLWPPSILYCRRRDSLMATYGDRATTYLRLLDRHRDIAVAHGQAGIENFFPIAELLAVMTFRRSVRDRDRDTLRRLVHKHGRLLGWRLYLAQMALVAPGIMKQLQSIHVKLLNITRRQ